MTKNNLRSLNDIEAEYFQNHPDEIDAYVSELFEEYARDSDTAALLASLRIIAKVKGISDIAEAVGITRQGLQKALSSKGNPRLENINAIMQAMGYQLMPQKIETHV
jgi:probable addiction module antidote protein